jgi:hypothetical protein
VKHTCFSPPKARIGNSVASMASRRVTRRHATRRRCRAAPPAAVVFGNLQGLVAFIHGPEQTAEIVPDGARVVRIGMAEGAGDRFRGQEPAILAEGDEEHTVEDFLRGDEQLRRRDIGIGAAQLVEGLAAQGGVFVVVVVGQFAADAAGIGRERVEMGAAGRGDDALGAEQEGEAFQGRVVVGERGRLEAFVGEEVVALVEEARLTQVGDEEPGRRKRRG